MFLGDLVSYNRIRKRRISFSSLSHTQVKPPRLSSSIPIFLTSGSYLDSSLVIKRDHLLRVTIYNLVMQYPSIRVIEQYLGSSHIVNIGPEVIDCQILL